MAAKKLTRMQELFIKEYLIDLNATKAALRAGYCKTNPLNADKVGPELLGKTRVKAAIDAAMVERTKRIECTGDDVVKELMKIAFSDMKEFASWAEGSVVMKSSEEIQNTAAVSEVTSFFGENTSSTKFKLHDKVKALELLGKHFGLFNLLGKNDEEKLQSFVDLVKRVHASNEKR